MLCGIVLARPQDESYSFLQRDAQLARHPSPITSRGFEITRAWTTQPAMIALEVVAVASCDGSSGEASDLSRSCRAAAQSRAIYRGPVEPNLDTLVATSPHDADRSSARPSHAGRGSHRACQPGDCGLALPAARELRQCCRPKWRMPHLRLMSVAGAPDDVNQVSLACWACRALAGARDQTIRARPLSCRSSRLFLVGRRRRGGEGLSVDLLPLWVGALDRTAPVSSAAFLKSSCAAVAAALGLALHGSSWRSRHWSCLLRGYFVIIPRIAPVPDWCPAQLRSSKGPGVVRIVETVIADDVSILSPSGLRCRSAARPLSVPRRRSCRSAPHFTPSTSLDALAGAVSELRTVPRGVECSWRTRGGGRPPV